MPAFKYFLGILVFTSSCLARPSAVIYELSGGRLGDQLSSYINARWIAYKYNIEFIYREFKYSDKFVFHQMYTPFDIKNAKKEFKKIDTFSNLEGRQDNLNLDKEDTLYRVHFYHLAMDMVRKENATLFHVIPDWNDEKFISILRKEIASIESLPRLDLSDDKHNVAVHVRTGFQVDKVTEEQLLQCDKFMKGKSGPRWDQKFPPYSFYVEQIIRLSEMLNDEPMYVHIFTDSPDPERIVTIFKALVDKPNITFGFRSENNGAHVNILEDFFAIGQCDYLIRGISNFSIVADRIGKHKIVISPINLDWKDGTIKVVEIATQIRSGSQVTTTRSAAGHIDWEKLCRVE